MTGGKDKLFKIYDGRDSFYQWDIDRKLIVDDAEITQVHFCNRTDEDSLVCETYEENGLTLVNVPNILLQQDWRINAYAYDKNYTKFSDQFNVVRRAKPENYVYTETEILNYNSLLDRVEKVEVDLTGYATEKYVDDAVAAIELTPGPEGPQGEPGPAGPAGYTPVKGTDYFTEADKIELVADVEAQITVPSGAKAYSFNITNNSLITTEDKARLEEIFANVNSGNYDMIVYINGYNCPIVVPSGNYLAIYCLTNNSTFDKYILGFSNGALTTTQWNNTGKPIDASNVELNKLASPSDAKASVADGFKYLKNNYATKTYVDDAVAAINIPEVDLTGYYTKSEIDELLANLPVGNIPSGEGVEF